MQNFDIISKLNFETDHRMIRCVLNVNIKNYRKFIKTDNHHLTNKLQICSSETAQYWQKQLMKTISESSEVQH